MPKLDYIKTLRYDRYLWDSLCDVCDIEVLPESKTPADEFGHLSHNIPGKTFAKAGSGSEYILLEDSSVVFRKVKVNAAKSPLLVGSFRN
jgi:hypothetical protein